MAEVQLSEPLFGQNFTDRGWRAGHAGQTGILDDFNGSSFGLTLPAATDVAQLGSTTQPSRLAIDGYGLEIGQGTTQSLTIPASPGGGTNGRTDLIVARLNLSAFTTMPGPVRLARIAGTEGSLTVPAATYDQDGIRDLPLYAVRRRQGESLNQAIVTDMRPRLGHNYDVHIDSPLPVNAPLASRCSRGGVVYRRDTVGTDVDWVEEWRARSVLTGSSVATAVGEGFDLRTASTLTVETAKRTLNVVVGIDGSPWNPTPEVDGERRVIRIATSHRPLTDWPLIGIARNTAGLVRAAAGRVDADGWVTWHWASTGGRFPTGSVITLSGPWETTA